MLRARSPTVIPRGDPWRCSRGPKLSSISVICLWCWATDYPLWTLILQLKNEELGNLLHFYFNIKSVHSLQQQVTDSKHSFGTQRNVLEGHWVVSWTPRKTGAAPSHRKNKVGFPKTPQPWRLEKCPITHVTQSQAKQILSHKCWTNSRCIKCILGGINHVSDRDKLPTSNVLSRLTADQIQPFLGAIFLEEVNSHADSMGIAYLPSKG